MCETCGNACMEAADTTASRSGASFGGMDARPRGLLTGHYAGCGASELRCNFGMGGVSFGDE